MAFSATITITGSTNITNFDIYQCPTSGCTGCVAITGSTGENVSRMKLLTGHTVSVDQGYRYIKLVADTETCNNSICMEVVGIPTFTLTPTPTPTATNIPNSTPTPTPTSTTVGPTPTPTSTPTNTPTPTATNTPTPTPTPICDFDVDVTLSTTTPTPTPTSTPGPLAQFSVNSGSNSRSSVGIGVSTFTPTITVTNGPVFIRLRVTVQTGYQGDTTLTVPGAGSVSPTAAQGAGQSTFTDFQLGTGVYNCTWDVNAISDGTTTVATATITQI